MSERVVRFFTRFRDQYPVTRQLLRDIANQYHAWIEGRARERRIPILAEPEGRRDEFVDRFFRARQARRGGRHPQGP